MSYSTVRSIVNNYKKNFTIEPKKKGRWMGKKVSEEDATFIQNCIDQDCTITMKMVQRRLLQERNLNISCSTISRHLKKMKYSRKRITRICRRSLEPEREHIRVAFVVKLIQYYNENRHIIFYDEAGFQVSMRHNYGRSLIGRRAAKIVTALR